jgi:hypothetical protein
MVLWMALMAAVSLAGCGGEEAEGPPAPPIQACTLFTRQDAEAAAGIAVNGTLSSTMADVKGPSPLQCTYTTGSLLEPGILSLEVRPARSEKKAARVHASDRDTMETLSHGKLEEVPRLGDAAYWAGGGLMQLHVLAGRNLLIVTVQPGKNQLPAAKQIAAKAIDRLKAQQPSHRR